MAYSTFANGGTRYAPQVAAAVVSPSGKVVKRFTPQVTGHVNLPPATYQALLTGFERRGQQPERHRLRGLQGLELPRRAWPARPGPPTARSGKEPTAWFVGFGPTADPQYVVVCVIDQAGYGATAAAPVVGSDLQLPGRPPGHRPGHPPSSEHRAVDQAGAPAHAPRPPPPPPPRRAPGRPRRPPPARPPGDRRWPGSGRRRSDGLARRRTALGCRGRWSPSGHGSNPCWPRSPSRPATSAASWAPRSPSTADGAVSWLLIYPDTYEIGLPNQGLQILYEILNERDDAVAERTYAPWVDMEAAMRAAGVPLFSLENHLPAAGLRRAGLQPLGRAGLHQRPQPDRPGRRAGPRRRPDRGPPAGGGRRPLRLQPRAPGRLRRLLRARGRRGGGRRDQRGDRRGQGGASRRPGPAAARSRRSVAAPGPGPACPGSTSRPVTRPATSRRPRRRTSGRRRPAPAGRRPPRVSRDPRAGGEADHRRPGPVALPQAAAGAAHRGGPRPPQRRAVPGLHPGLPVLPGRDDHPPGAGAAGRAGPHHGDGRPGPHRVRRGGPDLAVQRRLLGHRGHGHLDHRRSVLLGPGVGQPAQPPGGRLHRRDRRPDPAGAAHRAHLRPRRAGPGGCAR